MTDIVARVRDACFIGLVPKDKAEIFLEAADEIERLRTEIERLQAEKKELLEAIRLTAEYYLPPALDNWEWWKVYGKYADPEDAQRMKDYCDKAMAQEARRG